jgi:hypothetical protein
MFQLRNPIVFFKLIIHSYQNIIAPDVENKIQDSRFIFLL